MLSPVFPRAPTAVVSLENTLDGGIFPQSEIIAISEYAHAHNVAMHLDGARIWHVAAETGTSLRELCDPFDTVSLCLSKGLGRCSGQHAWLVTDWPPHRCTCWIHSRWAQGIYPQGPPLPQVVRRWYEADGLVISFSCICLDAQLCSVASRPCARA